MATIKDDFTASKTTTGYLDVGSSIAGVIEKTGDRDWFKVSLNEGDVVKFYLNGTNLVAPSIKGIYNASGLLIKGTAEGTRAEIDGDYFSSAQFTPTATGDYYVSVGSRTGIGSYELSVSFEDIYAPDSPVIDPIAEDNVINIAEKEAGVVISGTSEADSTVTLTFAYGSTVDVTADSEGAWNYELTEDDYYSGLDLITATTTNSEGRTSDTVETSVNVDLYAPYAPYFNVSSDNFISLEDKEESVVVHGETEGNATITLTFLDGSTASVTADSEGVWDYELTEDDYNAGVNSITATATDLAGNISESTTVSVSDQSQDDFSADADTTGDLSLNDYSAGKIDFPDDHDWFAIELNESQSVRLEAFGAGNDNYYYTSLYDIEGNSVDSYSIPGTGTYYVDVSASYFDANSNYNYKLIVLNNVWGGYENDNLEGSELNDYIYADKGNDFLVGQEGHDRLYGGYGKDSLSGGNGDDVLNGGRGIDELTGGSGADTFVFDTPAYSVDKIIDFNSAEDTIRLSYSSFPALQDVYYEAFADSFISGSGFTKAKDTDDYLIYDTKTGALYYDDDAKGTDSTPVKIAILGTTTHPQLTADDFSLSW